MKVKYIHVLFISVLTAMVVPNETFANGVPVDEASAKADQPEGKVVQVNLFFDDSEPAIAFAAKDLKDILSEEAITVSMKPLADLPSNSGGSQIVIAKNDPQVLAALNAAGGAALKTLGEQDYVLRVTAARDNKAIWAIGGDRTGAMYGGIHIGEIVKAFGLEAVKDEDQSPYIAKRGIKFNIPLDDRLPSHDDRGTAAQTNIVHMWDFNFWTEYLDVLARQRYNVLSLWNKHPFPAMVKLKEYPRVATDDVYAMSGKVLDISIDQKIVLWKRIMDYAHDRGIEIYIITWNVHMGTARGKHGIRESAHNDVDIDYLRKSVKELFITYPRLAGIGVTSGENMKDMTADEKEAWLWETYGKGIQDFHAVQPDRHIRFIHRFWLTDFDKIDSRFGQLKDGYDMSFKYAKARIYSSPALPFAEKELLPHIPDNMATWWNLRNDDIYNLRWGDPEYVKHFILNFPKGEKTAGYYMGSDRYAWGRESISKNPLSPRMLENEKHWYSFLLWGRLGYDPETPVGLFKGLIERRFPAVSNEDLFVAWQAASEVIPLVNQFHWFAWDYLWWPEAGISSGSGKAIAGYHDIIAFINAPVMDGSGFINITDYADAVLHNKTIQGKTPLEVADMIEASAKTALEKTAGMKGDGNNELSETLGDIRAMAYLGNYYAAKIRGGANLRLYQVSREDEYKTAAIANLEEALTNWQEYAKILDAQYIKMNISIQRVFDWDKIEIEIREDINIARNVE